MLDATPAAPVTRLNPGLAGGAARECSARELLAGFRGYLEDLGAEVDRVRLDGQFRRALDAMALFWRYSPTNEWLILRARPDATRVAGRRVWARLGRTVKPGETPIEILAPMSPTGFPFRVVEVFDQRQTRGRRVARLDLELRGRTRKVALLERAAKKLGVRVIDRAHAGAVGVSFGGEIHQRPGLPQRERTAVLAHELAHELLHQRDPNDRRSHAEVETEAEATSYVVLRALGLPSKAPAYIAWSGGSGVRIARSFGRIQRAARTILEAAQAPVSGIARAAPDLVPS